MRAALLFSLIISSSVLSTSVGRGSYPSQGSPLSPASNPLPFPLRASAAFSSKPARHSPLREFQVDDGENEKKRPRDQSPDVRSRHLRVSSLPSSSPAANGTSQAQAQQAQASAALAAAAPTPHPGRNSSHAGAAVAQGNETSDVMRSSAGLTLADVRRHMQQARRPALNRANMSGSEAGDGGDGESSMPLSPKSRISQGALHHLIDTPIGPPSHQPIKKQICARKTQNMTRSFYFPPSSHLSPLSSLLLQPFSPLSCHHPYPPCLPFTHPFLFSLLPHIHSIQPTRANPHPPLHDPPIQTLRWTRARTTARSVPRT
jgi:hypothetical protein